MFHPPNKSSNLEPPTIEFATIVMWYGGIGEVMNFWWSTNPLLDLKAPQKKAANSNSPMPKLDLADGDHWLTPKGASIWTQCHPHPERAKRTTTTRQHSGIANGLRSANGTNITGKFRGFKFFFNRSSLVFLACDMHRSCKTPKAWRSQLGGTTRQAMQLTYPIQSPSCWSSIRRI